MNEKKSSPVSKKELKSPQIQRIFATVITGMPYLDIPKIEVLYRDKGLTLQEFCNRAHIARTTWYRLRRADQVASEHTWLALAKALEVDPSEIAIKSPLFVPEQRLAVQGITIPKKTLWGIFGILVCTLVLVISFIIRQYWIITTVSVSQDHWKITGFNRYGKPIRIHDTFANINFLNNHKTPLVSWNLDTDSEMEFLYSTAFHNNGNGYFVCLDNDFTVKWTFQYPNIMYDYDDITYDFREILVSDQDPKAIYVTIAHHNFPSAVVMLDFDGNMLQEFRNPGHLSYLIWSTYHGKRVIIAAGVNNWPRPRVTCLVMLDPNNIIGSNPFNQDSGFERTPLQYARLGMPYDVLGDSCEVPEHAVMLDRMADGLIRVGINMHGARQDHCYPKGLDWNRVYFLNEEFEIVNVQVGEGFYNLCRYLKDKGFDIDCFKNDLVSFLNSRVEIVRNTDYFTKQSKGLESNQTN